MQALKRFWMPLEVHHGSQKTDNPRFRNVRFFENPRFNIASVRLLAVLNNAYGPFLNPSSIWRSYRGGREGFDFLVGRKIFLWGNR